MRSAALALVCAAPLAQASHFEACVLEGTVESSKRGAIVLRVEKARDADVPAFVSYIDCSDYAGQSIELTTLSRTPAPGARRTATRRALARRRQRRTRARTRARPQTPHPRLA